MFDNLLESSGKRQRNPGGAVFSVTFHSVAIALAVLATGRTVQQAIAEERAQKVVLQKEQEKPPEPDKPPPEQQRVAPPPPKGFQILSAPVEIPNVLPDIDLSKKVTDEADFTGKGVAGGTSKGVAGGVPQSINTETTYYDFQVEKVAAQIPGVGNPDYPEMLKNAGVEGQVDVQFVIDTTGRADVSTFKVLKSTHPQFTEAVHKALPKMRFFPAEVGGKKVKQLVQLPFLFGIK
jgi:protein TonB